MARNETHIIAVIFLCAAHGVADAGSEFAKGFTYAIDLVVAKDRMGAKGVLDRIPDTVVVHDGLAFVRNNPALSDEVRQFCFQALVTRGAAKTDDGYRLFIDTLLDRDPVVQRWSVAGLAAVPKERRGETVEQLVNASRTEKAGSDNVIRLGLGILQRWGKTAAPALPLIEEVFHNPGYSKQDRSLASCAMLHIGPVSRALAHFTLEDAEHVLGPLGELGGRTHGMFFDADDETRRKIRAYVADALTHEDPSIRRMTLSEGIILSVYGKESILGNPKDGFHVNPDLVAVVERVAATDPDLDIRELAQRLLDTFPARLEKAARKRLKAAGANGTPPGDGQP